MLKPVLTLLDINPESDSHPLESSHISEAPDTLLIGVLGSPLRLLVNVAQHGVPDLLAHQLQLVEGRHIADDLGPVEAVYHHVVSGEDGGQSQLVGLIVADPVVAGALDIDHHGGVGLNNVHLGAVLSQIVKIDQILNIFSF